MDSNTIELLQTVGIFLALFGFWWRTDKKIDASNDKLTNKIDASDTTRSDEIKALDAKLSGEIKEVRLASEAAHKEINEKLNGIQVTQARHSERFNTVNEQFNAVKFHIKTVDDKVDQLREGK